MRSDVVGHAFPFTQAEARTKFTPFTQAQAGTKFSEVYFGPPRDRFGNTRGSVIVTCGRDSVSDTRPRDLGSRELHAGGKELRTWSKELRVRG